MIDRRGSFGDVEMLTFGSSLPEGNQSKSFQVQRHFQAATVSIKVAKKTQRKAMLWSILRPI